MNMKALELHEAETQPNTRASDRERRLPEK